MTPEELQAIRERANNATPGPWEAHGTAVMAITGPGDCGGCSGLPSPAHEPACYWSDIAGAGEPDAVFIAHARKDIPKLLDHVDTLTARLEAVRELHNPHTLGEGKQYCESCVEAFPWGDESTPYPCPTIQAIDGDL